ERSEVLYFTQPYYFTPASVAVNAKNTSITEPSQLSGKKIGVGVATTYDSYLEGKLSLQDETGANQDVPSVTPTLRSGRMRPTRSPSTTSHSETGRGSTARSP